MKIKEIISLYNKIVDLANNDSFCIRSGMGLLPVDIRIKFIAECFELKDIEKIYDEEFKKEPV